MIKIRRLSMYDDRPRKEPYTEEELKTDVFAHREAVRELLMMLSAVLAAKARQHDITKVTQFDDYALQIAEEHASGKRIKGWLENEHAIQERHHLDMQTPTGVTLLDVIEYLADKTIEGLERYGESQPMIEVDSQTLVSAVFNTQQDMLRRISG